MFSESSPPSSLQDGSFRKIVEIYAQDEEIFFKDFAAAFSKLLELGVTFPVNSERL
jgi:cytochrome c peroxidase